MQDRAVGAGRRRSLRWSVMKGKIWEKYDTIDTYLYQNWLVLKITSCAALMLA